MRHDTHFVEELAGRHDTPVGKLIPLSAIEPDPRQPRSSMGDLPELVTSIRDKGVLEPILVRLRRRWRAAGSCTSSSPASGATGRLRKPASTTSRPSRWRSRAGSARDRPDREPPAQGPHPVRRGRRLQGAGGPARLHPRADRGIGGQGPDGGHREPFPAADAGPGPRHRPGAGDHLQVAAAGSPQGRRRGRDDRHPGRGRPPGTQPGRPAPAPPARPGPGAGRRKPYIFKFRSPDKTFSLSLVFRQSEVEKGDLVRALEQILSQLREAS